MAESEGTTRDKEILGNVFVFTAPRFDSNSVQDKAQLKRKHFSWEVSHFDVDLNSRRNISKKSKIPGTSVEENSSSSLTENTEKFSDLNLECGYPGIRNSVIAYLEDTFSENTREVSQGFNSSIEDRSMDVNITPETTLRKTTAQQEYTSSLEQSQKLFDKMQGFAEMSMDGSLTCRPGTQSNSTQFSTEADDTETLSNSLTPHEDLLPQASTCVFTKLSNCTQHSSIVNIFVAVMQVNPIKEIKIKSGINSGQYVMVSSVLVGDPTKEYFKLTFWRKAAKWVNNLKAGDVIVVKKLRVEKWNQEFYGQSTFGTILVNLQRNGSYRVPAQWLTNVCKAEAKSLLQWLKSKHPYLLTQKTPPCEDVQWSTLQQFVPNTLVHYRAKIVKVLTYGTSKGKYEFEKRKINKIVAVAIDEETSEEVLICLWGSQADWQYDLKSKIGQTWNFTYLRVECQTIHGELYLHTTPQSTKFRNQETSPFLRQTSSAPPEKVILTFSCIPELLEANLNGEATITAGVTKIMRTDTVNSDYSKISKTSDLIMVHRFFRELVYLGCKMCLRALKQDQNGIYTHCSYCIKHRSSYGFGVMYCFKPCMVYLSDKSASIIVTSSHESTRKFLKDVRPQDVLEESNNKLYQTLHEIFNSVYKLATVVLKCKTVLDENGFIKSQNFDLLDLQI